ncbi:MAG: sulfite exporter TauE/SafE family protein [Rhodobacter sp.]|nr:sulfite exporter TauE/SafE family protein [Rhodobacter sp.]
MSPDLLAGLLAASFAGSFITVAFGIGGGALLLAVLASLLPPAALIPVHGVVQIGSNLSRAILLFRHVFWPALPLFALGSVLGSVLGGLIVVEINPRWVQAGVGAFILWSVLSRPPAWLKRWPAITGAISSFLTMFFGATGLFVAGYTKSQQLPRHAHVATHATLMSVQHGLKVIIFGFLGFAFGDWWLVIAGMMLAGVAGTLAGKGLLNRMSDVNFKRALDVVLILISLRLIWVAIRGGPD